MKLSIIAATATLLVATTAQAGTTKTDGVNETPLYTKNFWNVANYTYDNGSAEQCVMGTTWTERKTITSGWYLKFNLDTGLWWTFAKQSWRMKPGNEVSSVISVDDNSWSGRAVVQSGRDNIGSPFSNEEGTKFLVALRKAKRLSIVFPTAANETPFIVKMDHKALAAFEECSSRLIADSGPDEAPTEQEPDTSDTTRDKFRGT